MTVDLTCRSCDGSGKEWGARRVRLGGFDTGKELTVPCTSCDGTGTLDRHHIALTIARAHGTRIAVDFTGLSDHTVRRIRRDTDGPSTPGRPTRAEVEAMAPRLDCTCPYCLDHRATLARKINHVVSGLGLDRPALGGTWRDDAACNGADPDLFFPGRGQSTREPLAYCRRCPVRERCLEAGLDEHHGIWGGLTERGRRRVRRIRRAERSVA